MATKCAALTVAGSECSRNATLGGFCASHQGWSAEKHAEDAVIREYVRVYSEAARSVAAAKAPAVYAALSEEEKADFRKQIAANQADKDHKDLEKKALAVKATEEKLKKQQAALAPRTQRTHLFRSRLLF